jgi:recombination associated protein RdgC
MGLLSLSVSVARYQVNGKIDSQIKETVLKGLKKYCIDDIENEQADKAVGWTSFDSPFKPDFEGLRFEVGPYFIFSLRIDKKTISPKIIQKYFSMEVEKYLKSTGKQYLSKTEKKNLKDHVISVLALRIPATPNVYDLVWNHEASSLYFSSTSRSANEELEALFFKTFGLSLIRLFPYTTAELIMNLDDKQKDILLNLSPTDFTD